MKKVSAFLAFTILPLISLCHPLDGIDVSALSGAELWRVYIQLGFTHILPLGLDHILFVLALFFLSTDLKAIILQATAFTVAHSITLGLGIYNVISPPASIVEPIIALSILFVAVENIIAEKLNYYRLLLVFAFGLIHGLGFAGVLGELGMPPENYLSALFAFNIGVELGQLSIILLAWFMVGKWFSQKTWYKKRIVWPASGCIALIALYWTVERTFFAA